MIDRRVGSYIIEAELGRGGMGAVYRARHVTLGRPAAIKILLSQYSANEDIVQRFFNEARAATEIRHLGIVEIYDFGTMDDGAAYIAMELLEGESLATRMKRQRYLGTVAALRIIRQICGPLGAAHERQIVHRDLKPDNVYIIPDQEVEGGERIKLLDFGIAKIANNSKTATTTGAIMGTPMYMSPEQCRGVSVDWRADIYAVGCMLYELVSGRTPFQGEGSGDVMGGHMYQPPEPIPNASTALWALLSRMLAKKPDDRPQSTREVATALDAILKDEVNRPPMPAPPMVNTGAPTAMSLTPATPIPHSGRNPISNPDAFAPTNVTPVEPAKHTTLSSGAGSTSPGASAKKSRAGLYIASALVIVGGGAAATVFATRGNHTAVASIDAGSGSSIVASAAPPDAPPLPDAMIDAEVAAAIPPDAGGKIVTKPKTVDLFVSSVPTGSSVSLNGKVMGVSPIRLQIPVNAKFTVDVQHAGFTSDSASFTTTDKPINRVFRLKKIITGETPKDPPKDPPKPPGGGSDAIVDPYNTPKH